MTVEEHAETCVWSLFLYFSCLSPHLLLSTPQPPQTVALAALIGMGGCRAVCWEGAVWEKDVCFSLAGERGGAGVVSGGGRNDLGHPIKWGWRGLKSRGAVAPSQESCDSLKLFATASASRRTTGDLVDFNKNKFVSKDLRFIED